MEPLLKWAEQQQGKEIEHTRVLRRVNAEVMRDVSAPDPTVLAGHIWSYLNAALTKSAATVFRNLPARHGLEAWRRIYRWVNSGSAIQRRALKRKLDSTPPWKSLEDVAVGIENWELTLRQYEQAGGKGIDDEEKRLTLVELLPDVLSKTLSWRTEEFKTYEDLKEHVLERTEQLIFHHGGGRSVGIHAIPHEEDQGEHSEEEKDRRGCKEMSGV